MAIRDDLKSFLEQLDKSTADGRIAWQDGAAEGEFIALMRVGSLRVSSYWDREQQCDVCLLQVLNDDGKVAEQITSEYAGVSTTLWSIHSGARRKARNADDVISKMMEDMK